MLSQTARPRFEAQVQPAPATSRYSEQRMQPIMDLDEQNQAAISQREKEHDLPKENELVPIISLNAIGTTRATTNAGLSAAIPTEQSNPDAMVQPGAEINDSENGSDMFDDDMVEEIDVSKNQIARFHMQGSVSRGGSFEENQMINFCSEKAAESSGHRDKADDRQLLHRKSSSIVGYRFEQTPKEELSGRDIVNNNSIEAFENL